MILLQLIPVILSSVLVTAHFLRADNLVLAMISLAALALLLVPARWAARLVQIGLALAALEWVRTLVFLTAVRMSQGEPWIRMVVILGLVALFTGSSILVFRSPRLRNWFQLN
jgi:hypothetical protein